MLNCCIERRRASRTRNATEPGGQSKESARSRNHSKKTSARDDSSPPAKRIDSESEFSTSSNDDDEFFEALESQQDTDDSEMTLKDSSVSQEAKRPEGVSRQCGDLTILTTKEPLFIPITQVKTFFRYSLLWKNCITARGTLIVSGELPYLPTGEVRAATSPSENCNAHEQTLICT